MGKTERPWYITKRIQRYIVLPFSPPLSHLILTTMSMKSFKNLRTYLYEPDEMKSHREITHPRHAWPEGMEILTIQVPALVPPTDPKSLTRLRSLKMLYLKGGPRYHSWFRYEPFPSHFHQNMLRLMETASANPVEKLGFCGIKGLPWYLLFPRLQAIRELHFERVTLVQDHHENKLHTKILSVTLSPLDDDAPEQAEAFWELLMSCADDVEEVTLSLTDYHLGDEVVLLNYLLPSFSEIKLPKLKSIDLRLCPFPAIRDYPITGELVSSLRILANQVSPRTPYTVEFILQPKCLFKTTALTQILTFHSSTPITITRTPLELSLAQSIRDLANASEYMISFHSPTLARDINARRGLNRFGRFAHLVPRRR